MKSFLKYILFIAFCFALVDFDRRPCNDWSHGEGKLNLNSLLAIVSNLFSQCLRRSSFDMHVSL